MAEKPLQEFSVLSEPAFFEMGLLSPSDWQAKWIDPETEADRTVKKPVPYGSALIKRPERSRECRGRAT